MSDLKVTAATEAVRVARTSPDGGRQRRQASPQRDDADREGARTSREQTRGAFRAEWEVAEDGALRIRLLDGRGRTVAEVTPEELLARAGGSGHGTGLLLQAQT